MYKTTMIAVCLIATGFIGCKKNKQDSGEGCDPGVGSGITLKSKSIMLWLNKDLHVGTLTLEKIVNRKTGLEEEFHYLFGHNQATKFFTTQPECGDDGAITVNSIDIGYDYDYTLKADNGETMTGTFSVNCTGECQAFLIQ